MQRVLLALDAVGQRLAHLGGDRDGPVEREDDDDNLDKANQELLKISSEVIAHNVDVSQESEITRSLQEVHEAYGRIDGLVNNAPSIHTGKIVDLDLSAWKTNFKAFYSDYITYENFTLHNEERMALSYRLL